MNEKLYAYCDKCMANYEMTYGRLSKRPSCRKHTFIDGACTICELVESKKNLSRGCFHHSTESVCCECAIS